MEKRYVAGQAIDKEALLDLLQKNEVDELWVTFDNPFNYVRSTGRRDYIYLIWYSGNDVDKYWRNISCKIMEIFDPDFASDEDEIVARCNIMSSYKTSEEELLKYAARTDKHVTKIYKKGVGFIG